MKKSYPIALGAVAATFLLLGDAREAKAECGSIAPGPMVEDFKKRLRSGQSFSSISREVDNLPPFIDGDLWLQRRGETFYICRP